MSLAQIAAATARDPVVGRYLLLQRIAPGYLLNRLERFCAAEGLRRPAFILSFDCDTDRDIAVAWNVHARLKDMGIRPVYAVPGEILVRGADVWKRIADTGSEFMNHGYREHTIYRDGQYISTLFYDRMPANEVDEDIQRGHDVVERILGTAPRGFRTPHFGTFADDEHISALHRTLSRLGYSYSSSTTPYVGLRYGPFMRRCGLVEMPVTGCADLPMMILDSYTFRFTPGRFGPDDYVVQARRWATLLDRGRNLFVNIYADPSQVSDWEGFFSAMRGLAPHARSSYGELLAELTS